MIGSGHTRVYALLGDPVAHSVSPAMQNAAFRAWGLDAVYVALRTTADALPGVMAALVLQGGGGNVTVPHKAPAAALVSAPGGPLDVCNTFWSEEGRLTGCETDSTGIIAALAELGTGEGGAWHVAGTGGSARAVLAAAARVGARVAVRSRAPERGAAFLARAGELGVAPADAGECTVAINCTPLGLADQDPLPFQPDELPAVRAALDLVYRRGETEWVRRMRAAGVPSSDGRTALLAQGALSFERWFPGRQAPREVMHAAVRDALC
jgi:shikimate dehydrogenase